MSWTLRTLLSLLWVAALLGCPTVAFSEPSPTTLFLMGEPASMLDMGVLKFSMYLSDVGIFDHMHAAGGVMYDYETNRIVIEADHFPGALSSIGSAKRWCREMVGLIRSVLDVDPDTCEPKYGEHSNAVNHFSHDGYSMPGEPPDLGQQLDALIEIRVHVGRLDDSAFRLDARCGLLEEELYFSE